MKLAGSILMIVLLQSTVGFNRSASPLEQNGTSAASTIQAAVVSSKLAASTVSFLARASQLSSLSMLSAPRSMWGE